MTVLNGMCDSSSDAAAELSNDNGQPKEPPAKVVVATEQPEPEAAAADADTSKEASVELAKPEAALVRHNETVEARPESSSGHSPMRTLGDIILERLNHEITAATDDSVSVRDACSELLAHLVDQVVVSVEETASACPELQLQRQPPESLCCSVPLDKVASVLQQQQQQTTTTTVTTCQQQEQKRTTSTKHLCLYCDRKFPSIPLRQKHVERVHQPSPSGGRRSERNQPKQCNGNSTTQQQQSCQYCERPEGGLDGLFRHMVGSHSDRYHGCLPCRTRYLTSDALATHLLAEHVDDSKPKEPDIPDPQDSGGGACNSVRSNLKVAKCPETAKTSPGSNAIMPIDISLTAATPVHKDDGALKRESEESSELANKPGKACIRAHPRRVSFEKYNFPRKYDGKEQWSCSIKDLSRFDISTQLSLRRKQQQRDNELLGDEGCTSLTEEQLTAVVEEAAKSLGEESSSDSGVVSCKGAQCKSETEPEHASEVKVKTEPTVFSGEFESFMRLTKWNEASNTHRTFDLVYAELTGEWSRPRIYICAACAEKYETLKELEEHKQTAHPNVWCVHFEFSGEHRELHKHLVFLPSAINVPSSVECPNSSSSSVKTRQQTLNSQPPEKVCTKCSKLCVSLSELHKHMLECGGDQTWLLGLFGISNGKKKCKWRPFGSRRRRQRGMKRNIHKSQTPRNNCAPPRERPSYSGPRVRPSDRESIQKMLANLPAKRATRKVLQENAARSQSRLRNVQSRSRAADSQASRLVASKAALRNKLLKNAKSYQRKKNLLQEKREQQQQQADDDEAAASAAQMEAQLRPRKLLRVLARRVKISSSSSSNSKAQKSRQLRSSGVPSATVTSDDLPVQQQQQDVKSTVPKKVKVVKKVEQLKSKIKANSKPVTMATLDSKSMRIGGTRLLTRSKLRTAAKLAWREHERISRRVTRLRSLEEPQVDDSQPEQMAEDEVKAQQSDRPRRTNKREEDAKPNKIESRSSRSSSTLLEGTKKKSLEAKLPVVVVSPSELKQGLGRTRPKRDQQAKEPHTTKEVDGCSREASTERRSSRRLSLVTANDLESPKKDSAKTQSTRKSIRIKEIGDAETSDQGVPTLETSPTKEEATSKRRSSLRRQTVEGSDEISRLENPKGIELEVVSAMPEDECDKASSPLEALQHESSNSNLDSGKENYSTEPVVFQQTQTKARVARPKKSRHQSRKSNAAGNNSSSAKRTLSSVIGILTEGVNVPVVETAIVLTVLTSHDAEQPGNPACHGPSTAQPVASSSSQQPVVPAPVSSASESASPDQQQQAKPLEAPSATTTVATPTTTTAEKKPDESQACSSGTAAAEEQPTNDIIRDLARRKPKGKGSFLEKIVSKIAKSKDVSLEGGSGGCCSLLDVVSRNSTNSAVASGSASTAVSGVNNTDMSVASTGDSVPSAVSAVSDSNVTQVTLTEVTTTQQQTSTELREMKSRVVQSSSENSSALVNDGIEMPEATAQVVGVATSIAIDQTLAVTSEEEPKTEQESSRPPRDTSPRKNRRKPVNRSNVSEDLVAKQVESPKLQDTQRDESSASIAERVPNVEPIAESSTNNLNIEEVSPTKSGTRRKDTSRSLRPRLGLKEPVTGAAGITQNQSAPESENMVAMDLSTPKSNWATFDVIKPNNIQIANPTYCPPQMTQEAVSAETVSLNHYDISATNQIMTAASVSRVDVRVPDSDTVGTIMADNVAQSDRSSRRKRSSRQTKKINQNCTDPFINESEVVSTDVSESSEKTENSESVMVGGVTPTQTLTSSQNTELPILDGAQSLVMDGLALEGKSSKRKKTVTKRSSKNKSVQQEGMSQVGVELTNIVDQSERKLDENVSDECPKVEESAVKVNGVVSKICHNNLSDESKTPEFAGLPSSECYSKTTKAVKQRVKVSKELEESAKNIEMNTKSLDEGPIIPEVGTEVTKKDRTQDKPPMSGLDAVIAEVSSVIIESNESSEETEIPQAVLPEIKNLQMSDQVGNVDLVGGSPFTKTSKAGKNTKRKPRASENVPEVVPESSEDPQLQSTDIAIQNAQVHNPTADAAMKTNSDETTTVTTSSEPAISDKVDDLVETDNAKSSATGKRNRRSKSSKQVRGLTRNTKVADTLNTASDACDGVSAVLQDVEIAAEEQSSVPDISTDQTQVLSESQLLVDDVETGTTGDLQSSTPINNRTSKRSVRGSNQKVAIAEISDICVENSGSDLCSSAQDSEAAHEKEPATEDTPKISPDDLSTDQPLDQDEKLEKVNENPNSTPMRKSKMPKRKPKKSAKKAKPAENLDSSAGLSNVDNPPPGLTGGHGIVEPSDTQSMGVEQEETASRSAAPENDASKTQSLEQDGKVDDLVPTPMETSKSSKRKPKANNKRVRIDENLEKSVDIPCTDMTTTPTVGDETITGVEPETVSEIVMTDLNLLPTVTEIETYKKPTKTTKSAKQKKKSSKSRSNRSNQQSQEAQKFEEEFKVDSVTNAEMTYKSVVEVPEQVHESISIPPDENAPTQRSTQQTGASDDPITNDSSSILELDDNVSERSRRASKRNSEFLAEILTSDERGSDAAEESFKVPELIENARSSRKRATKKKANPTNDSLGEEAEKVEIASSGKFIADEISSSITDSIDGDISTSEFEMGSRRSSRRSNRTSRNTEPESLKESDDSDISSANEMDSSRPRRSQRSKNVVSDISRDSSVNSVDADVSSEDKPEKKQMLSRKANKNVSLVDDHLELPSNTDTINESSDEIIGASENSSRAEEYVEGAAKEAQEDSCVTENSEVQGAEYQLVTEKIDEIEKSGGNDPKIPKSQLSSVEENADSVESDQSEQKSLAADPSNQDLQTPKKRLAGNFAIVTKSGKILIVEKKKKFTKEVARFFCEICNTSFTRKSSLKKHNLSQSHILQATMSGDKEVAEEIQDLVEASSQPKKAPNSNVLEAKEAKETEVPERDEGSMVVNGKVEGSVKVVNEKLMETEVAEQDEDLMVADGKVEVSIKDVKEKLMECEPPTIQEDGPTLVVGKPIVETDEQSIDLSLPKLPNPVVASPLIIPERLFSHKSPEDELEDEMLDEEICKITENMSHDEYVLTDHVSPVTPEAASTPVKELEAPAKMLSKPTLKQQKRKKENEKEKKQENEKEKKKENEKERKTETEMKKRNLADEHLSLDTPAPVVPGSPPVVVPPIIENQSTSDVSLEDSQLNAEVAMITNSLEEQQVEATLPTTVSGKREQESKKTVIEVVQEPAEVRRTGRKRNQNAAQTLPSTEGKENSRPRRNQLRPSYREDENTDLEPIDSPMPKQQSEAEKSDVFVEPKELSRSKRDKSSVTVTESETSDGERDTSAKKATGKKKQSKKRSNKSDVEELVPVDDDLLKKIDSGIIADVPAEDSNPDELETMPGEMDLLEEQAKVERDQSAPKSRKKQNKRQKVPVVEADAEQLVVVTSEILSKEQAQPATVDEEQLQPALVEEASTSTTSTKKQPKSRKSQNKRRKKNAAQEESPDTAAKSDEAALPLETSTKEISTPDKINAEPSLIHVGEISLEQHNEVSIPSADNTDTVSQDAVDQVQHQTAESKGEPAHIDAGFDSDENSLDTDNMSVDIQKLLDDPEMTSELAQQVEEDSQGAGNIDVLNIKEPIPIDTSGIEEEEQNESRTSSNKKRASSSRKSSKLRRPAKKLQKKVDDQQDQSKSSEAENEFDQGMLSVNESKQETDNLQSSLEKISRTADDAIADDLSDTEQPVVGGRSLRNRSSGSAKKSKANPHSSGRSRQSKKRAEELISRAFHDDSPLLASDSRRSSQRQSRRSQQTKSVEGILPKAAPETAPADDTDEDVEQEPLPLRQGPSSEPDDNSCSEDEEPLPEYGRTSSPTSDDLLDDDEPSRHKFERNRNPRTLSKSEEELTIETTTEPEDDDDEDEDNTLDYDRAKQEQHQQQQPTKVLNFDEELFVECCSRLKASSENELRGAKKIKLDHFASMDHGSGGQYRHHQQFARRDDVPSGYKPKDRWRDVESQNSLGTLLESVNQLLGEEHNSNEKDYSLHGSSKRRSHHHHHHKHHKRSRANRSASPGEPLSDGDDEADDDLGYDDSLDVAFEHNNKLRDKIQQRMRESESLIATSFAKSSPAVESNTYNAYSEFENSLKQPQEHHHKNRSNNGMGGMLDKALSTLLNNEKRDHNGSAPMKLLAELACARAPTSTTPTTPQPLAANSIEDLKDADSSQDSCKHYAEESDQSSHKKATNPIKELFERKKESQDKKQVGKIKISLTKSTTSDSKPKKQKSKSKSAQHNLPLIRTSQFRGGMAERKKRRDDGKKKQPSDKSSKDNTGPKDVYDFDEEESPSEIDLPPVLSFRAKAENSREFSMSALLSKTIGDTLSNGKSISAIGENLESMVDRKFKDIDKFAPKNDGQTASSDGPRDESVERKFKSKRTSYDHSANKQSNKSKKKNNKNVKKKSRNAWYENDSSDEFVTKLRDDDLQGVGLSKSQRTCSKGKQNLFAEMSSTSSDSEFENTMDNELSLQVEKEQSTIEDPTEKIEDETDVKEAESGRSSVNPEPSFTGRKAKKLSSRVNEASSVSETESKKGAESEELSDQPLIIDESLKELTDQRTNSDVEIEDRPYVLDDLYREDSSIVDSDRADESAVEDTSSIPGNATPQPTKNETPTRKPSKKSENTSSARKRRQPSKSGGKKKPKRATSLPEKLPSNAKPDGESENLPLHVFLSRKVQLSKKRKQQQELAKLIEVQQRLMPEDQPTRSRRKCAIGKQGLLAEFSSSDDEDSTRSRHRQLRRPTDEIGIKDTGTNVDEATGNGGSSEVAPAAAVSEAVNVTTPTTTSRTNKPKQRESKERRRERYIEKKHEQMIAKEQRAIEEAIMRELEEKRLSAASEAGSGLDEHRNDLTDGAPTSATQDTTEKSVKSCSKSSSPRKKPSGGEAAKRRKSSTASPQKSKKQPKTEQQQPKKEEFAPNNGGGDDDEELKMGRSWNKVDEDVGVAIGRRKRAAANQLYYWSSSSDDDDRRTKSKGRSKQKRSSSQDSNVSQTSATQSLTSAPNQPVAVGADEIQEGDRPEQHGWIVGDSHKRMITMLAMEKQMKEKRRRSENDEQAPGAQIATADGGSSVPTPPMVKDKSNNKKHRNSTS
ncbi:hypothetical protein QAD02_024364 [Eretmocerus hayati]|uniref:Uncharacterized protein n=1 Tax=Eretmocerus hayati TaxID=131215 RepID=A0ACC2PYA2_9HYME|nr:hypothetical protein QAD02_024364 [Eretmocerus hayati]